MKDRALADFSRNYSAEGNGRMHKSQMGHSCWHLCILHKLHIRVLRKMTLIFLLALTWYDHSRLWWLHAYTSQHTGPPEGWLWASGLHEDRRDCGHRWSLAWLLTSPQTLNTLSIRHISIQYHSYTSVFIQYHYQPWYFQINLCKSVYILRSCQFDCLQHFWQKRHFIYCGIWSHTS